MTPESPLALTRTPLAARWALRLDPSPAVVSIQIEVPLPLAPVILEDFSTALETSLYIEAPTEPTLATRFWL